MVYTVDEFCQRQKISRWTYYDLKKQGLGPRIIRLGKRDKISEEAEAEWRRSMEQREDNAA